MSDYNPYWGSQTAALRQRVEELENALADGVQIIEVSIQKNNQTHWDNCQHTACVWLRRATELLKEDK